ncbi:MAG: DUF3450 domain-containing protein [Pseudomonadales bacterium]|nr:DUF3450 domain-containing protein [Pseudomonadales bacterium]
MTYPVRRNTRPARSRSSKNTYLLFSVLLTLFSPISTASDIHQATEQAQKNIDAGAQSQKKIDRIDDQTQTLFSQYKTKLQQLESLDAYNRQLQKLVSQQQFEQQRLDTEIQQIVETERKILPLIEQMTTAFEQFIALDMPFLPEERSQRVAELKRQIQRPDITTAEKFRRIMEAYQIENDYGRTLEAYRGPLLTQRDGEPLNRTVEFLKIGRVVLLYQTLDGQEAGLWNQTNGHWQIIESNQLSPSEIKHAFQVARRQASPDLLMLPIPAPEKIAEVAP